ncbi:uncharacterized protein LOC126799515 [Argentina anserina]|uniref:uncharacterized protein LOC126799515 n=1 Tax=Argentina anserina TaxID=57926 RepID=UPI00217645B6|nr:uncharacterized protein LOC126799515 [Potentilla anserina]
MPIRNQLDFRVPIKFLAFCVFLSCFPGCILSATVTLDSIEIYNTHELLKQPTVYFKCQHDQNKTVLPDVKDKKVLYKFNGQESWQPLTELNDKKCKRCGFYEEDAIKSDDVFEEWELCPSDFGGHDGKFRRVTKDEFNATFLCPKCDTSGSKSNSKSHGESKGNGIPIALVLLIVLVVLAVCMTGVVAGYKHWQKKKRQQEQARFLKLFEDGDDIEDELGLDHVI